MRPPLPSKEEIAKLPADGGPKYNRLIHEQSPYLLQHAANPVDWHPWGEAAFEHARKVGKPVFLSVGYSTCHWCHVMEHESFEDDAVAALMNKHFVCIKVDREERPDVDHVYMTVTQALTGRGGWPMTVFMTPDKKPFFAGTYFPKTGGRGRPGMMELLPHIGKLWSEDKARLMSDSEQIVKQLREAALPEPGQGLTESALTDGFTGMKARFDSTHGGFGRAPKFPTPHMLSFLVRSWRRTGDAHALEMVEKTLTAMRHGGVYDHVGFGYHRYSTDREWLLPHFEKMLYDQALLVIAYVDAYQATGKAFYADVAREILAYVLRDMTSPEGGFYSAEDADSEGEEGLFYLWKTEEVRKILGPDDGKLFIDVYNLEDGGNYNDEVHGGKTGRNIPHLKASLAEVAKSLDMTEAALRKRLDGLRRKLFAEREKRIHPYKDDKILTDWNGLMIAAFGRAAQVLDEPAYAAAATKAADFVLAKLRGADGRLIKRYRQGHASLPAHLDDYAFTVWGLLELYETTFEVAYLTAAIELSDTMLKSFWDSAAGGMFMTAADGEELIFRSKEVYDGAMPSGNSVAALNLLRLNRITARKDYEEKAGAIIKAFSTQVAKGPSSFSHMLMALDFDVGPSAEIVLSGDVASAKGKALLAAIRGPFHPNKVVVARPVGDKPPIVALAPYTEMQLALDGEPTVYVCENFACKAPVTTVKELKALLAEADK